MAIVHCPALSLEASGNLGAICYSRWRSLQIARGTWTGTYPNTAKQQAVNSIMTTVSQSWAARIPEDREAWEAVARSERWKTRLGDDMTPTGYQLYCKINCLRLNIDLTTGVASVPPILPNPVYVETLICRMSEAWPYVVIALIRAWPWTGLKCDGYNIYKAGPYDSGGRRALAGEYRWLANKKGTYYIDSALVENKWYWYKVRWFFYDGFVGNFWIGHVQAVFP